MLPAAPSTTVGSLGLTLHFVKRLVNAGHTRSGTWCPEDRGCPLHFFAVSILASAGVVIALIWKSALPAALTVQLTVAALIMMFALICL